MVAVVHVDLNLFVVDLMFVLIMVEHLHHLMEMFQIMMETFTKRKKEKVKLRKKKEKFKIKFTS